MRKLSLLVILLLSSQVFSQDTLPEEMVNLPGVKAFQKGDYNKAAKLLKRDLTKDDENANLWNLLGITHNKLDEKKDAAKAFKKAVSKEKRNPVFRLNYSVALIKVDKERAAIKHLSKVIDLGWDLPKAYMLRGIANLNLTNGIRARDDFEMSVTKGSKASLSHIFLAQFVAAGTGMKKDKTADPFIERIQKAKDIIEKCFQICNDKPARLRKEFENYQMFIQSHNNPNTNYSCTSLKVTYKPRPGYTAEARSKRISGSVRVKAIFGKDGKISAAIPLSFLGGGLTNKALIAAYSIGFEPAQCGGQPTSVLKTLVFNFKIR